MLAETYIPPQNNSAQSGYFAQGFLKGIPSSSGIAMGKALIIEPEPPISSNTRINADSIESEIKRFHNVLEILNNEFDDVLKNSGQLGAAVLNIIETYKFIINDSYINSNIEKIISSGYDSESALIREYEKQKSFFLSAKDEILRDRANDLENVKRRLISVLHHRTPDYAPAKDRVLIAQTLSPTDIVKYKEAGALAVITEMGGIASHLSILARSFEMPAVIGVKDATKIISSDTDIIIDGFTGLIIYNPDFAVIKRFKSKISEIEEHKKLLGKFAKIQSETLDKHRIHVVANVDRLDDVKNALISGAEGVGLVRSESFLANTGKIPVEDIQYGWYKEIADRMYPEMVTIRCFDVGSDKFSAGIPQHENNPALGLRGIRFLLYSREVLTTQLRAILRASVNKNIRIMIPMISDTSEVITVKKILAECMKNLDEEGISYDKKIKLGIMIETPAAVMISDILAKECDFFSIGTNDLTQYTLAADRTNDLITEIYDSFHPAVLKLIKIVADNASKHGIPVGLCGELAGHSAATPLLLGLGIKELSVPPSLILELKKRILETNMQNAKELTRKLLEMPNSNSILKILESELNFD